MASSLRIPPRWRAPALSVGAGIVYLLVSTVGGHPGTGVAMLAVMVVFAIGFVLVARRSETMRGLLDRRDERINLNDLRANGVVSIVLIVALLVCFVVELARGHSGAPYDYLAALAGGTWLVAIAWFNRRG